MASITLTGTLLDPTGEVAVGDQIRFTHRTTTGETIQFARSVLIIPPNGLYNITLEFGLIFVEYLDIKDVNYKSLGVVTVNGDTTATDLPGLLNAIVPPTDAQLLLFQGILADTEDARDIALLAAAQQTTLELIASTTTHPNSTVLTLSGHTLPGDGGGGKWQLNGVVGQTTSQSPTQLAAFLLNDGNGNQWALVDGVVLAFNAVQYLPLPFGATGNGNYAYNNNDFDKIVDPDRLNPATIAVMVADTSLQLDDWLTVQDYATGHNSGYLQFKVVAAATGTADGGSFIDLPNTTPALQAQQIFPVSNEISVMAFGAKRGGVGVIDATAEFIACKDYCIANDFTMFGPDGDFWFVADLDLWGVRKIKFNCRILFTLTTTKLIVGGSTISVPSTNIELYVCSGTIQVYGMNRGDLKFNQANTLYLFASNLFSLQRFTVSYCRFEWVNVDNIHLECQDPAGSSGAWINENKFYGGRTRVSFLMDGTYPMNNNIFYGMALESMDIDIQIGQNTHFHDVRLEKAPDPVVMSLNFGAGTFNNIFWLTWGNFANTSIWDQPAAAWAITDAGDNNRIVSAHYAYTEKDVILNIDRENLGDGTAFIVSPTNADKVQITNNAITICDTGKIQVTDKLWFRHTGQVASFFIRMEVYDEDGVAITAEPGAGFKDSQGATVFNVAGFYEYTNPVLGGAYAVNPIKDTAVKYVRFLVITDNGAAGDEHTNVRSMLVQPQEDKRPVKNILEDKVRVDVISNRVSATSEATAIDLFKFTSGAFVTADASGSLAGTLEIALTGEKGSVEDATKATVDIMVTKEDTGTMVITTGTPVFLSNGGALLIDGITLATKAGATTTEAILTITITSSSHSDPFDALRARARLTGIADFNNFGSYLIAAEAI